MVIRASSAAQINALIADLASSSSVRRDAAVARLTVIGARAVERLCAAAADASLDARVAALRALEGIGDPRALRAATTALGDSDTAVPAIGVLRRLLSGPKEIGAIEALAAFALDRSRPTAIRVAAAQALGDLGPTALKPLWKQLESDPDPELRRSVGIRSPASPGASAPAQPARIESAIERSLPDDPAVVRRIVGRDGVTAPLASMRRLIELIRDREESAPARLRSEWMGVRAAAHVALAGRGSRVALYDLRDSLAAATGPLPVEFLAAVTKVGDVSCLEPLAAAYARSTRSGEDWWRQHLRHTFHTIVQRARISRRHAAMKKVLARWPAITEPA